MIDRADRQLRCDRTGRDRPCGQFGRASPIVSSRALGAHHGEGSHHDRNANEPLASKCSASPVTPWPALCTATMLLLEALPCTGRGVSARSCSASPHGAMTSNGSRRWPCRSIRRPRRWPTSARIWLPCGACSFKTTALRGGSPPMQYLFFTLRHMHARRSARLGVRLSREALLSYEGASFCSASDLTPAARPR